MKVLSLLICASLSALPLCLGTPTWVTPLFRYRRQQSGDDGEDGGLGDPADANVAIDESGLVDLHNQQFCVDVSTYGPVTFEAQPRTKCDTVFNKRCETKTDQVCDEVTEIQCDIVPYTECQMTMEATTYNSFQMVNKEYLRKNCTEGMDTVQHIKMMPECKNVTKQNCITKWEEDENGKQVWAGNEACEPVTWRECKLVPREVDFKVPKVDCKDGEPIPYTDCEDTEKVQMTTRMTCEVRHTTNCEPVVSTKCQTIEYQECHEEPEEECEEQEIMVPTQEKEHKKKCLLPDDGTFGGATANSRDGRANSRLLAKQITARGVNGKLKLQGLRKDGEGGAGATIVVGDRLGTASARHPRTFQGQVGQPRIGRRNRRQQQRLLQQQQQEFRAQNQFHDN